MEWIYTKQIAPRDKRGHLVFFRGSHIQKYWEAVKRLDRLSCQTAGPIGTEFGSRLRIRLGMDIG